MAQQLFDRIVSVQLWSSTNGLDRFLIATPPTGPKPDITVKCSQLPQGVAIRIQVDIKNICMDSAMDIYKYDMMDIEIGYYVIDTGGRSTGKKQVQTLRAAIFNAYPSAPNPNGVMTFIGITGGHMADVLINKRIYINMYADSVRLESLVGTVAATLGIPASISESLKDIEIPFNTTDNLIGKYSFQNGYALLQWLAGIMHDIGQLPNVTRDIVCFTHNDCLYALDSTEEVTQDVTNTLEAIAIGGVTALVVKGPIIEVKAPFNPLISPNKIVSILPSVFTTSMPNIAIGRMGPNSFLPQLHIGTEDNAIVKHALYRVITMEVTFSTSGTNEMNLFCAGGTANVYTKQAELQMKTGEYKVAGTTTDFDETAAMEKAATMTDTEASMSSAATARATSMTQIDIEYENTSLFADNDEININFGNKNLIVPDAYRKFLSHASKFLGSSIRSIQENGVTFADIAKEVYTEPAYKSMDMTANAATEMPMNVVMKAGGAWDNPVVGTECFYPIIILATHNQFMGDVTGEGSYVDVTQSIGTSITPGKNISIPSLTGNIVNNTQWAEVFKDFADLVEVSGVSGVSAADAVKFRQIAWYMEN